ncbi:MAG: hypothetical protein ABR912_05105 [Terracidiphilus sp.]|jgi:hypothetical protein
MRRHTILEVFAMALFAASVAYAQQPQKFTVTASIWEYKSLCEFQDPVSTPFRFRLPQGKASQTITGCQEIEKQHGHAPAIRLLVKNAGATDEAFQIESLNAVILRLADGRKLTPIAIRWPWNDPLFGGPLIFQFYTELTGSRYIQVPPGAEINLVFLFNEAPKGTSVQIGSMAPVTIR